MPKTIETTVYLFHELSDKAKDKARAWWREVGTDYWYEQVYDDASQVGIKIKGFDIGRGQSIDMHVPSFSQTAELIISNHRSECDTYRLAKAYLQALERIAEATEWSEEEADEATDEAVDYFRKELEHCYLKALREQYEYEMSDEAADENIEANEYTFTADGKRFG